MWPSIYICLAAILCFTLVCRTTATLHDLDLSNLDISSHVFFKNFPDLDKKPGATLWDHIDQHFQKKQAVAQYFGRLFFGTPQDNEVVQIQFDPHVGYAYRPHYERRYGYRGEQFIDAIGKGYSPVAPDRSGKALAHKHHRRGAPKSKEAKSEFRIVYA